MTDPGTRKTRVLFLPKWYPNRYDPMPGLFIQRQAEALTAWCDVAVVYVHPDPRCPGNVEVDFSEENQVRVLRVYYRSEETGSSYLKKNQAFRNYKKAFDKAIDSIREFKPDLLHAHILTRVGYIAMKKASEWKIPFVVSEHWSRYFPENGGYQGWLRKRLTEKVCRNAAALVAVSEELRRAMIAHGISNRRFVVVPNVVDSAVFQTAVPAERSGVPTMIHVSCFDDRSKNISGLLRSLRKLADKGIAFRCVLAGEGPDLTEMKEFARFLRFDDGMIEFTGLLTGNSLTLHMAEADFAVISSRFETFGTVIAESLAAGLPVVSTRVGIAPEVVNASNGILVVPGDDEAMTGALESMIRDCKTYNRMNIRQTVEERFSSATVGRQLFDLYEEVLATWKS